MDPDESRHLDDIAKSLKDISMSLAQLVTILSTPKTRKPFVKLTEEQIKILVSDGRPFLSKYPGICQICGKAIQINAPIVYAKAIGSVHFACLPLEAPPVSEAPVSAKTSSVDIFEAKEK